MLFSCVMETVVHRTFLRKAMTQEAPDRAIFERLRVQQQVTKVYRVGSGHVDA